MIPVDQTRGGIPGGNCFSACVASLLHLPIEEVPYFMDADDWVAVFARWLLPRGLYPVITRLEPGETWRPAGYHILGGESPSGPHAVVARGLEIVHDPHPSRAGLVRVHDATILVPHDIGAWSRP